MQKPAEICPKKRHLCLSETAGWLQQAVGKRERALLRHSCGFASIWGGDGQPSSFLRGNARPLMHGSDMRTEGEVCRSATHSCIS